MTRASAERAGRVLLLASLGVVAFNLAAAQTLFGLAALVWLILAIGDGRRPEVPAFFLPLVVYAALSLMSALVSFDPRASLIDQKQLVLLLMVPIVMRFAHGEHALRTLNVIIAVGAAAAMVGVLQYAMLGFDTLANRPDGALTHYMTYSGVIMLVLSAAVARLLFYPHQIIWPAVAVPALAVALGATQTRGAWIGAIVAIGCLVAVRRARLLIAVPVIVGIGFLAAPPSIKDRVYSIVDQQDESNRDRIQMLEMGAEMVRDYPWFGVGPEMVGVVYARYLRPDPVHTYNPHLHNVPMQIAAERGLPALIAWVAFIVTAVWGLARQVREGPAKALAAAGLAAIAAMLAAGLFEYNFGDSELLMLFLGIITLPFAARHQSS